MKNSVGTAFVIIVLSLVAWVFFYLTSGPLQAPETMVVVGFCACVVIAAKALWTRLRKPKKESAS